LAYQEEEEEGDHQQSHHRWKKLGDQGEVGEEGHPLHFRRSLKKEKLAAKVESKLKQRVVVIT
jgi:hypothetical protein